MKKSKHSRFGEIAAAAHIACSAVGRSSASAEQADAQGVYTVECRRADGSLRWSDTFKNVVTTVGKNFALDTYLSGSAYTAAWYMGLMSSVSYAAGAVAADTMASHAGWTEDQSYSQGARPTVAFSAAAAGAKATSAALVFSINATATIKGCFLTTIATKGGTTGTLYSAGLFTGGDKACQSGDTLNVSYSASL